MSKLKIKDRFATTPVDLLNNQNVTLKAKGLYGYLQSKPDGWDFTIKGIVSQLKEGFDSVREAIKELENEGYLIRDNYQNELGQWDCDYELFSQPKKPKPLTKERSSEEKPYRENPYTDNSVTVKPLHISKKEISKKEEVNISLSLSETKNSKNLPENQNQDTWKSEITDHPLFAKAQSLEFSNLDAGEVDYTLELYQASLTNGRRPHFTQAVSWLKNRSLDKKRAEKITTSPPPKQWQNSKPQAQDYSYRHPPDYYKQDIEYV